MIVKKNYLSFLNCFLRLSHDPERQSRFCHCKSDSAVKNTPKEKSLRGIPLDRNNVAQAKFIKR